MTSIKPLTDTAGNIELVCDYLSGDEQYKRPFNQNTVFNNTALDNQCLFKEKREDASIQIYLVVSDHSNCKESLTPFNMFFCFYLTNN